MDWDRAVERNSKALEAIIAGLFAMLGLGGNATVARIPRELHRAVLSVLRPAESALRRLIIIVARGMVAEPNPARPMCKGLIIRSRGNRLSFRLFDRRKRFVYRRKRRGPAVVPRIHVLGDPTAFRPLPPPPAPADDGQINARRLILRLHALKRALGDLPREARRLVRLRVKRGKTPGVPYTSPMRPGRPPGHRRREVHAIDRVLADCHYFAFEAMKPDTS